MLRIPLRSRLLAVIGTVGALALVGALAFWGLSQTQGPADAYAPDDAEPDAEILHTEPPVSRADEVLEDPATWVIADGSVGAVHIGGDFAETLDELPAGWGVDETCGVVASWDSASFDVTFSQGGAGIGTIAVEGGLGEPSHGPRTPDGLGLGSTRDEVKAVYPTAEDVAEEGSGAVILRVPGEDPRGGVVHFQLSAETDRVVAIILTSGATPEADACS